MYKIREIKYSLSTVSIQVYRIENRKRKIIRHIGTASNEQEKLNLIHLANDFIKFSLQVVSCGFKLELKFLKKMILFLISL